MSQEQYVEVCRERFTELKEELKFANKDIKEIREKLFNGYSTALERTIPENFKRLEKQQEKTDARIWWILGSVILGLVVSVVLKFLF